jgi:ubiquinone/menaquinone biosynthesis C-methylase UbiE
MEAMTDYVSNVDALLNHAAPSGKDVLDIGCGTGSNVRWFAEQGARPTGAECGATQLASALQADPDHVDRYVDAPGQDLPFDDESFDLVTFFLSLHHVPQADMLGALSEAARVLRPGGLLYVAEPVPEGPGHEMFLPVDDETVVRGYAQAALDNAAASGLDVAGTASYISSWTYTSYEECVDNFLAGDPDRQAPLESANDQLERNFYAYAERTSDGAYAFAQPMKVTMLRPIAS